MKILKYLSVFLMCLTLLNACGFDEDLNVDPNKPKKPDTRYLFVMAETFSNQFAWNNNYNPWVQLYPQYIAELKNIQFTKFSIQTYSTANTYSYAINNLNEIIKLNQDENLKNEGNVSSLGSNNNQIAVAMTLRAFFMMHLTDIVGALPYSEALKGKNNFTPKFDSQKEIYDALFNELEEAYTLFKENEEFSGTYDILYAGNISKWKKLNASIRMMMAIKLKKSDEALGKTKFAKAYADGGIVDNSDNLTYKFLLEKDNGNPIYKNFFIDNRQDFSPSATIIDALKDYNDPRLYEYAKPNVNGEYVGAKFGWLADEAGRYNLDDVSLFADKYYKKQDAPMTLVSASQVLLMAAEAAEYGWINDDVKMLYKKGITASFTQHNIDSNKADAYITNNKVALDGNSNIDKIAMQKWFANYMQDGVEAWSDWRRLQVPALSPGEIGSTNVSHIPYRLKYESVDIVSNKDNYKAAIAMQGADDVDTKLWWNK